MWKEEKLWVQSTNNAKLENRKGILKFCQQEGGLYCLRVWDPKDGFVFSPLLTQSVIWQGSQQLHSSFFFSFLGVAVLPPLEAELMWLLCLEGGFLFWFLFSSA